MKQVRIRVEDAGRREAYLEDAPGAPYDFDPIPIQALPRSVATVLRRNGTYVVRRVRTGGIPVKIKPSSPYDVHPAQYSNSHGSICRRLLRLLGVPVPTKETAVRISIRFKGP